MSSREPEHRPSLPGALDGFTQVKFGPGVVGRSSTVIAALVGVLGVGMWAVSSEPWMAFALAIIAVIAVMVWLRWILGFARENPNAAVLEGADLVRMEKLQQGAKNLKIINGDAKPVANTSPPKAITNRGSAE